MRTAKCWRRRRAAQAFAELERRGREAALQAQGSAKPKYEMPETDFRATEQAEAEERYNANMSGLDAMFDKAMSMKNARLP